MSARIGSVEFRRAPHLVLYWDDDHLVLKNYAVGRSIEADAVILRVLEQFGAWRSLDQYLSSVPEEARGTAVDLVDALHRHRWLRRRDDLPEARERLLDEWGNWNPSAGFFHTAAKNTRFLDLDEALESLSKKSKTCPMPAPVKGYPDAQRIQLPAASRRGRFAATLRERRTWRQFGGRPIELKALSTLLHMTAGVQQWVKAKGEGRVAFKTSPSGGARHPIEL